MGKFQSSKVFDGFSTVFCQWKAEDTHCRFLHGYGVSFKVNFERDPITKKKILNSHTIKVEIDI